jgi:acyl carrier protein
MEDLKLEVKKVILASVELEDISIDDIKDDEPLFGTGLGLDSIDALELGIALKKKFNVKFSAEDQDNRKHFASVNALVEYITASRNELGGAVK